LGNAEQCSGPLSIELRVRRPVSVLPSSNALSIQLNDRAGLSLLGSIFDHVVVIFGIGFIPVQENAELTLPRFCINLVNVPLKNPENTSLTLVGPSISIKVPV
jgi:hypothetical protein